MLSIRGVQFTSSSFDHEALVQQRNIGLDQSGSISAGGGGGACTGLVAGRVGGANKSEGDAVSGLSVTPPKVAASRISALSREESVQELDVSSIRKGRANMVVNKTGMRTRR